MRTPMTFAVVLALATLAGTGCARPLRGAAGAAEAPVLYVLSGGNAAASAIMAVDPRTGRVVEPAISAHQATFQLALGPAGSLLALSAPLDEPATLTQLWKPQERAAAMSLWDPAPVAQETGRRSPVGDRATWVMRWLPVAEPSAGQAAAFLAASGGRFAAVAYQAPGSASAGDAGRAGAACRLALVDLAEDKVLPARQICVTAERASALAFEDALAGPTAYIAVYGGRDADTHASRQHQQAAGGRVVAVRADTGALLALLPLAGRPTHLVLVPARDQLASRLYVVEALAGPEDEPPLPYSGRLLRLVPDSLDIEAAYALPYPPDRLAVSPDGATIYTLFGHSLVRHDVDSGREVRSVTLPDRPIDLAISDRFVFVASAYGDEVWVVDRRRDRVVQTISAGRQPLALLFDPGA